MRGVSKAFADLSQDATVYMQFSCLCNSDNHLEWVRSHVLAELIQTSMAGLLPSKLWTTEFTEIIWMVKVTAKGITPVRPVVICKKPFVLQKEHFLQLRGGQ